MDFLDLFKEYGVPGAVLILLLQWIGQAIAAFKRQRDKDVDRLDEADAQNKSDHIQTRERLAKLETQTEQLVQGQERILNLLLRGRIDGLDK